MLASPRLPNKSHNTGIFIANKGISNHNKDNGKAMLKNWTRGGWKAGTWPVHRGRPSPISAAISFDSILCLGSTSIPHLVQFLLRPSTVSAVAWFAFVWTIENCGCVRHCCRWARSCPTVLESATQGRLRVTAPQINALTHAADDLMTNPKYHWMEFIFQITLGEMCPWVGLFSLLQNVFFSRKNESQLVSWRDHISTKCWCILRFLVVAKMLVACCSLKETIFLNSESFAWLKNIISATQ